MPHGVANSEVVQGNELTSFFDFLAPKWKGKIVLSDPTISGTSPNVMAAIYKTLGEEKLYTTMISDSGLPAGRTAIFTSNTGRAP